jgi:hypothetical protein
MIIKKIISTLLLSMLILTMSGAPMLLHHCCGELESISFSLDHQDECCKQSYSDIIIDAPACCEDEIIETALNLEGFPHTVSILFISPMIEILEYLKSDIHSLEQSTLLLASFLTFPSTSSLFQDRTDLCIFRI